MASPNAVVAGCGLQPYIADMVRFMCLALSVSVALSGCALVSGKKPQEPARETEAAQTGVPAALPPLGTGQSASDLDQTTEADKAAAKAKADTPAGRELGRLVVALGSPAEQGFWLKSALIAAPGKGRVVTAAGASIEVDLMPGTGAALLSLAAFRALGLNLTDLPEVTVFVN